MTSNPSRTLDKSVVPSPISVSLDRFLSIGAGDSDVTYTYKHHNSNIKEHEKYRTPGTYMSHHLWTVRTRVEPVFRVSSDKHPGSSQEWTMGPDVGKVFMELFKQEHGLNPDQIAEPESLVKTWLDNAWAKLQSGDFSSVTRSVAASAPTSNTVGSESPNYLVFDSIEPTCLRDFRKRLGFYTPGTYVKVELLVGPFEDLSTTGSGHPDAHNAPPDTKQSSAAEAQTSESQGGAGDFKLIDDT